MNIPNSLFSAISFEIFLIKSNQPTAPLRPIIIREFQGSNRRWSYYYGDLVTLVSDQRHFSIELANLLRQHQRFIASLHKNVYCKQRYAGHSTCTNIFTVMMDCLICSCTAQCTTASFICNRRWHLLRPWGNQCYSIPTTLTRPLRWRTQVEYIQAARTHRSTLCTFASSCTTY